MSLKELTLGVKDMDCIQVIDWQERRDRYLIIERGWHEEEDQSYRAQIGIVAKGERYNMQILNQSAWIPAFKEGFRMRLSNDSPKSGDDARISFKASERYRIIQLGQMPRMIYNQWVRERPQDAE